MKAILLSVLVVSLNVQADTYVNGYVRSDGTYVQPHFRSSGNSTTLDNYSAQGNTNPYTGNAGSVAPYQYQNQYNYPYPPKNSSIIRSNRSNGW